MAKNLEAVAQLASTLFWARTQAHVFHLQTESYAKHKALDAFYTGIVDLADAYVELVQGKYGKVKGYRSMSSIYEGDRHIVPYFEQLGTRLEKLADDLPQDADITNAFADILALVHSTLYQLKFLS